MVCIIIILYDSSTILKFYRTVKKYSIEFNMVVEMSTMVLSGHYKSSST